jgi:glucoamylase
MRRIFVIGIIFATLAATPAFSDDFGSWIEREALISQGRMAMNISPYGTARGVVLASPSKQNPNYYYYWVRDGAMVMRAVLDLYEHNSKPNFVDPFETLLDYVRFSRDSQLKAGENLGEPRFNSDGSLNTEPWGRPQNDGPALRALTLMRLAQDLLRQGQRPLVEAEFYSPKLPADTVIKADLEYVAHHWQEKCVDLWEELWGQHFFTRAVQLAALREGAKFSKVMNDPNAASFYSREADALEAELFHHWSEAKGHYIATLEPNAGPEHAKPSELDASVILAALAAEQSSGILSITDGRILATADKLEQSFASSYAINSDLSVGTAIGRYPEDYYFGGNPWVLTTAAFAELNYRLASRLESGVANGLASHLAPGQEQLQTLRLDKNQANYFLRVARQFGDSSVNIVRGMDLQTNPRLKSLVIKGLVAKGDWFLQRLRRHVNSDGSFSEQFRADTGFMLSANDLSWSYASFLRAVEARRELPSCVAFALCVADHNKSFQKN